jgi:hypothetical protein
MKQYIQSKDELYESAERQRSAISWELAIIFICFPLLYVLKSMNLLSLVIEEYSFGLISLLIVSLNIFLLYEICKYRVWVPFSQTQGNWRGKNEKITSLGSFISAIILPTMFLYFGYLLLRTFVENLFN